MTILLKRAFVRHDERTVALFEDVNLLDQVGRVFIFHLQNLNGDYFTITTI